jgi:hypothetical protein
MFPDDGAGQTAIAYTEQFLEAGVARLDALFGAGYAKANPAALAGYLATCASNLNSFMLAASSLDVVEGGLKLVELADGVSEAELRAATEARIV